MNNILDSVRSKYAAVAASALSSEHAGVRAVAEAFGYTAEELQSIPAEANMGLSCGNPTAMAHLRPGDVIVDLGSGGGLDVFLAAKKVGPQGRAIGIDMTPSMIELARHNAAKGNYGNVEFHLATIDRLPLQDNSVDCVISNCVINLAPDKPAVFREIFRVLKPGGRLAASDIALKKDLPAEITSSIAAYVGCIAGAIHIADYQTQLQAAGFDSVAVIDSGKDLNAYAKVENQSGCCSPAMDETTSPFKIASSGCCGGKSTELHTDLKKLLDNYDVNEAAASVRVFALKPARSDATFIRTSRPEDRPFIDALLQTENLPLTGLDRAQGWVAEFGGQIIGHIALEEVKDAVVLRSLVVTPAQRGKGLARRLLAQAECAAGSRVVALRTKAVGPWVERLGYCRIDSTQLPKSLLDTSEFSGTLCSGFPIYLKGGAVTLPQTHRSNSCCGKQSAEKCRS